jgi:hypothetical protein
MRTPIGAWERFSELIPGYIRLLMNPGEQALDVSKDYLREFAWTMGRSRLPRRHRSRIPQRRVYWSPGQKLAEFGTPDEKADPSLESMEEVVIIGATPAHWIPVFVPLVEGEVVVTFLIEGVVATLVGVFAAAHPAIPPRQFARCEPVMAIQLKWLSHCSPRPPCSTANA